MISEYLGFDSDFIILGLVGVVIILLILIIVNMVQTSKLKKRYNAFMSGKTAKSLEDTLLKRLDQVDELIAANSANEKNIDELFANMNGTYQKVGLVKYDAFHEMGGKLSFALCMLDNNNNGYLVNVMHSNNGCFAYVKEIINGESFIELGGEEEKALKQAVAGRMGDEELSQEVNDIVNNVNQK